MELRDRETVFAVISDHGGTPTGHRPVDVEQVLVEAGLTAYRPGSPAGRETAPEVDWTKTRAAAIGLVHVFVNLRGREPNGIVPPEEYAKVQREVIDALLDYRHPATGERAFALALT